MHGNRRGRSSLAISTACRLPPQRRDEFHLADQDRVQCLCWAYSGPPIRHILKKRGVWQEKYECGDDRDADENDSPQYTLLHLSAILRLDVVGRFFFARTILVRACPIVAIEFLLIDPYVLGYLNCDVPVSTLSITP